MSIVTEREAEKGALRNIVKRLARSLCEHAKKDVRMKAAKLKEKKEPKPQEGKETEE